MPLSTPLPPTATPADIQPVYLAQTSEEAKQYVGDAVCAPCHTTISRHHSATSHARSLSQVSLAANGRFFQNAQTIRDTRTDTTYHAAIQNGTCVLVSDGPDGKEGLRAQIALGSGHNGQTYLGKDPEGQWFILRLSYYTHTRRWDFTPGQEPDNTAFTDPKGQLLDVKQFSACLSCHATSLQITSDGLDARHSRLGVGCESCHGPGKAHIASMRGSGAAAHRTFVPMNDLKKATPTRIMQICGGCHSTLFDAPVSTSNTAESFSRFAATALAQSRCFQSSGTLSCITCHDPHTDVATNLAPYEATCLRCHGSPSAAGQQAAASMPHPRVCKVNPRSGCIGCHMPTQNNSTFPHILFHNHWIKVWKPNQAAKS
jgi:hypothetical protein